MREKRCTNDPISSDLVLSGPIRCHLVLPGPIWCHLVLSGPVWCNLVLSSPIWCNLVLSGPILCYLVLSGPTWCYLVLSGPIWCSLVLNKEKYFLVKPLLRIHQAGWRSPPSQQGLNKQILFLVKTSSHLQVSVRTFLVKPLLTSSENTPKISSHASKTNILRNPPAPPWIPIAHHPLPPQTPPSGYNRI